MQTNLFNNFFIFDELAIIMIALIVVISTIIAKFSINHMRGDSNYKKFFILLISLCISTSLMVASDNIFILLMFLSISNIILVQMMIHKKVWQAAREAGYLALKNYMIGFCTFLITAILLFIETDSTSIKVINHSNNHSQLTSIASIFILVTAMTQSAIFPFNKWLLSSLNSPLPVSALMHAGLINGGGFLLVKFSHIFLGDPFILNIILIAGMITAIIGTILKLMQSDVKRMLACSTMAQMGFMVAQCGMGLFAAAISHIILHSFFKSYLFLSSASTVEEKKFTFHKSPNIYVLICSILSGALGSYMFAIMADKTWISADTILLLIIVTMIACSQISLVIMRDNDFYKLPTAALVSSILGSIYGLNVNLIRSALPDDLFQGQELNAVYITCLIILVLGWLSVLFYNSLKTHISANLKNYLYVKMLNYGQPHPKTVTTYRNYYKF